MPLEELLESAKMHSHTLQPTWSLAKEFPELSKEFGRLEQRVHTFLALPEVRLPIPKSVGSYVEEPFYRPPGSYRSFYCSLRSKAIEQGEKAKHAVVAFKGIEPCAHDIEVLIRDLMRPCYSPHNIAEHLVLEERKIPGCLRLNEAMREARCAALIQKAHLESYGCFARLPIPLFVFRHGEETESQTAATLRKYLSHSAFEILTPWISQGLGIYVYFYPSPPVRASDVERLLGGFDYYERMLRLIQMCQPEEITRRWVSGFVRMLYLNVIPGSLTSFRTGICCQPQNSCIDGGFVDVDSLTPIADLKDDTSVYAALQFSTVSLFNTVQSFLFGSADPTLRSGFEARFDLHYVYRFLLAAIEDAIAHEARPKLVLDERVSRYYRSARDLESLFIQVAPYYSATNSQLRQASQGFGGFGISLIASTRDS